MNSILRARLDQIDEWLCDTTGGNGRNLSLILSAIRGPDNKDREEKNGRTNRIRRAAFPKTFTEARTSRNQGCGGMNWYVFDTATSFQPYPATYKKTHFQMHAEQAAEALGLTSIDPKATK